MAGAVGTEGVLTPRCGERPLQSGRYAGIDREIRQAAIRLTILAAVPPRPDLLATLARIHDLAPDQRAAAIAMLEPDWRDAMLGLLDGPEPDAALQRLISLPGLLDRPPSRALTDLLHQGSYPARLMRLLDPAEVHALLADPTPEPTPLAEQLAHAIGKYGIEAGLGRVRTREYLRLARRELEHASLDEVGGALSDLAAACVDATLRAIDSALLEHVTVFGMGKLGGRELNFLSDIDLVFVHADEAIIADDENVAHRARSRLQDQLRKVVKLLEGSGIWRPLFHVDLRLRPFGTRGPLTISATALEQYYERHGRGWERQVWLRARPIAGNLALGELVLDRLAPFVWPRSVGPEVFDEIAAMMKRARAHAHTGIGGSAVDLKHDAGGIREIEFFVQALQRLHGGRNRNVRTRSTLDALDRLAASGLISHREHAALGSAYRVLRRIEHRVQLAEGQQTHRLPESGPARELLAARMAVHAGRNWLPRDLPGFDAGLAELRGRAQAITVTLTGESELAGELPAARELAQMVAADPGASPNLRIRALIDLGLRSQAAEESAALLEHLFARPHGPFQADGEGRIGAEKLLLACLDSADPEQALARLIEFSATRPAHFGVWRVLAAPDQQPLVRRIADLFGASEPLSRGLIGFPGPRGGAPDGGLALLMEASVGDLPGKDELHALWAEDRPSATGGELDDHLLLFKHRQLVRIGMTDLGRRPDPLDVGRVLSDLADLILAEILADLAHGSRSRADQPGFTLAVFALGKFGMQAMDYGSDLDLLFVFDPLDEGPATQIREDAQRLARQLISRLEQRIRGVRLYEVDMRLRPSGRQGLLVSSLEGFRSYHARSLEVWERLALVWLRPVGEQVVHALGPRSPDRLSERVVGEVVPASLWPSDADPDLIRSTVIADTRRLKQRIEQEIARESRDTLDVKTGVGGCLELELLVAALQLVHGGVRPELRSHELPIALARLAAAGLIDAAEASELDRAYRFERLLLNRLRMTRGSAWGETDRLTVNSPRLTALARRMGLADTDALVSTLIRHRATVRSAFDRHLPPADVP
jgi:glutamate-ammonia-ligase adenylyltransferase